MTRPESRYRDRRREIERELADVPAPAPPADLLDAIRSEIPADLAIVERARAGAAGRLDFPRVVALARRFASRPRSRSSRSARR